MLSPGRLNRLPFRPLANFSRNAITWSVAVKSNRKDQFLFFGSRFLTCAAVVSFSAVGAYAKVAAPLTIWAKADVSYDQFNAEALECGMQGLAVNIDNTEEVKALAQASKQLEAIDASAQAALGRDAGQMGDTQAGAGSIRVHNGLDIAARQAADQQAVIAATRPEEQYAGIKKKMFTVVRKCMLDRGYAKIVLTADQRNEYSSMKGGADARRNYIHQLASDPQVLETQRETPAP